MNVSEYNEYLTIKIKEADEMVEKLTEEIRDYKGMKRDWLQKMRDLTEEFIKKGANNMEIKVFVTNLSAYNAGELRGKWVTLPLEESELIMEVNNVLADGGGEEYFITDYEAPFYIDEYESLSELNEIAERLDCAGLPDENVVKALKEISIDREDLINILENGEYDIVKNVYNEQDLALNVDENFLPFNYHAVADAGAENYINWEAVGHEMTMDGWYISRDTRIAVRLFNQ